jgi:hypothetical protein
MEKNLLLYYFAAMARDGIYNNKDPQRSGIWYLLICAHLITSLWVCQEKAGKFSCSGRRKNNSLGRSRTVKNAGAKASAFSYFIVP